MEAGRKGRQYRVDVSNGEQEEVERLVDRPSVVLGVVDRSSMKGV